MDELTGYLSGQSDLEGILSGESDLIGYLSGETELTGVLSVPPTLGSLYDGTFEVVPEDGFQLLPTSDKYVTEDIIVHPIPYAEVSNNSGGYTATIGG